MNRTYLSFADKFKNPILSGEKTQTLRFNLQEKPSAGEELEAVTQSGEHFADIVITSVEDLQVQEVPNREFSGHRNYETALDVIKALNEYYHDTITPKSTVTLIEFKIK